MSDCFRDMDGGFLQAGIRIIAFLPLLLLFGAGCVSGVKQADPFSENAITPHIAPTTIDDAKREPESGSLWDDNGSMSELFVSNKAGRIGDILTVSIVESAKAANNADTKTERKSDFAASVSKFFNVEQRYPGGRSPQSFPYLNPFSELKAGLSSTFDGGGSTSRSGQLAASITVRITDVLPNGNLALAGSREVAVNKERQYITLTGIIRPQDISSDNVVQSTYVSDARISYSGVGVLNDRQRPGWIARALDFIWPF